jgi:divalent metal cation (Fe/Co/Zn/Cd) transporter
MPFNLFRAEWATALSLFSLLPIIGLGAGYLLLTAITPEPSLLGIGIALGAVLIMPLLWYKKRRIGAETQCLPLTIDAAESSTCLLMSITLMAGLTINYFLKIPWIDYFTTLIILIFIAKEAFESIQEVRGYD